MKLTDFGLSRSGIQHKHSRQGIVQIEESQCAGCPLGKSQAGCSGSVRDLTGTPDYMAPEILLGLPHGNAVDYWALGCILYEFLVGISPFSADTVPEVFDNIVNRRIEWPTDMSENAKDLIGKLLCLQTEQRLGYKGASEVKSHQFFAGIDWVLLRTQEAPFVPKFDGVLDTSFFTPRDAIYGTAKKEDIEQAVSLTSIQPSASQKGQNEHSTSKPSESEILGKKLEPTGSDTYLWVNFKNLAEKTREFLEETSTCASEPLEALSGPSLKKETLLPTVTQNELSQSTN